MNTSLQISNKLEDNLSDRALDTLIPAGLVLAFTLLCYQIIQPFVTMLVWSVILAVTLYPLHRRFATTLEGKQGRAATLVVIPGSVPIFWPTTTLPILATHSGTQWARYLLPASRGPVCSPLSY